jgi:hypothetical protein
MQFLILKLLVADAADFVNNNLHRQPGKTLFNCGRRRLAAAVGNVDAT